MRSTAFVLAVLIAAPAFPAGRPGEASLIQNTAARPHISLDGKWHVIVDPYENGFYNHRYEEKPDGYFRNDRATSPSDLVEYDFPASPELNVPGDWNSQDERLFLYEGTIWYEHDFALAKKPGKRYVLHFGAVNYKAVVYVNGREVGRHEGGFTPFQFDVTDVVTDGDNFVVVKADNRRERDNVPTVNTDWWNYGGITRPVRLLELDAVYVADWFLGLDPERDGIIDGWARIAGAPDDGSEVRLEIPELDVDVSASPGASGLVRFEARANPELWSPDSPKLYDVRFSFGGSEAHDRIGFRRIAVRGEDILLNGKPVFLRGISIHEEAPTRAGRAWSEEDAHRTLAWARELGCNFVRLAHYPHNEAIVRAADEMGLLVWSEIPVYWTIRFDDERVYAKAERQLDEMIARDSNRAAVVFWSVANETPNTPARFEFLERLVNRVKTSDSDRLVTAASDSQLSVDEMKVIEDPLAEIVDVIGVNSYCGWYHDSPQDCSRMRWQSAYGKPVIVSEFGAGALFGRHGGDDERWTEEYQAAVYVNNIEMLRNMSFVRGTTPWILKDFRSPRRPLPGIQDYWNRKGLLSEKGERKKAWYVLHDFYDSLDPP